MKQRIEYDWRLRELMAARGMNTISDLLPHLADRGIQLSDSQLYRLLGGTPERMNLILLGAILDVLDCSFEELVPYTIKATSSRGQATGTTGTGATPRSEGIRPVRARIHRPR